MAKKTEQNEPVAVQETQESPAVVETRAAEPAVEISAPAPEGLAELANRHRVPAWQQAALVRLMGWAEGKQVTEEEYTAALESLKIRRVGGGRME